MSGAVKHAYEIVQKNNRIEELEMLLQQMRDEKAALAAGLEKARLENEALFAKYQIMTVDIMALKLQTLAQTSGLKIMRQIMMRIAKGEVAYMVRNWHSNLTAQRLLDEERQRLNEQMDHEMRMSQALGDLSQSEALKLLKKLLWGMMKGQLGQLFMAWRDTQRAEHEQAALDKLKAMANRGAMQMLKMTLLGMVKGKIGVCVACWLGNLKHDSEPIMLGENAALQAKLNAMSHLSGVKMLKQVMAYMLRGELGMRLVEWRASMRTEHQCGSVACIEERRWLTGQVAVLRQKQRTANILRGGFYGQNASAYM